ncbi:MAG: AlwI family type II restriction endonuclease [Planctomycetota bacterium]|nr:MAG: AlwI family type II restriction endonuclease [Planctomycetota bacterium]
MRQRPWYLGNTTVRSPFRLREGLIAIQEAGIAGALKGRDQELRLCGVLEKKGVIASLGNDETYSIGRKWRAALAQLGFLWPEAESVENAYEISPNGQRLISSDSVAAWQECFLRSLLAYQIPSEIESDYQFETFSPLRHVLEILDELSDGDTMGSLSPLEMGAIVQFSSPETPVREIVSQILSLREARDSSERKMEFDRSQKESAAQRYGYVAGTIDDYADLNQRYLKATGLVQSKGRGFALSPRKLAMIKEIVSQEFSILSGKEYIDNLCNGAKLPTDNKSKARIVLENNVELLLSREGTYDLSQVDFESAASIEAARHDVEDILFRIDEKEFADSQAEQVDEIIAYLELLLEYSSSRRTLKRTLTDGREIVLPRGEGPAYFEWAVWRAFLAVNSLINEPWESRRFKIDQDFLPVGTAPGRGSDIVFEFSEFVLVVEVTLTTSSRQEAAEGEPVRRHIAQYAEQYAAIGKDVFGLFIACDIDTNTANTLRLAEWYLQDDRKLGLQIVPMPLSSFKDIIEAVKDSPERLLLRLKDLIMTCRMLANQDAPVWKEAIVEKTAAIAEALSKST